VVLDQATLRGADFTAAVLVGTKLISVDLSGANGLNAIDHFGPSIIDSLLRGAGVPDNFIAYIGSLVGKPIEFYSCFISYATKDQAFALRLTTR
jgi:uncharacterized protein YjbI with pentapeptide repeats